MSIEESHESKLLRINSKDKLSANMTSSDFVVNIGSVDESYDIRRVVLKSATFWNTAYNVKATSTLSFNTAGFGAQVITFTPGRYTWAQLKADLETQMSAILGEAFTATENAITKLITMSAPTQQFSILPSTSTFFTNLGFTTDTGLGTSHTAQQSMDLGIPSNLYFSSKTLSPANMIDSDNSTHSIFADVPITVGFGELQTYHTPDDELNSVSYKNTRHISQVDIRILSPDDDIIDLRGAEVSLVFKIYY